MATYLLTFVIGMFTSFSLPTKTRKLDVKLFCPPKMESLGQNVLTATSKSVDFYEEYFGVPYSLNKLDVVLVYDLAFGASESWGCVLGGTRFLLMDEKHSELELVHFGTKMVCHEIVHMWFGDLVTVEFWDDVWMKEGFARYLETFAMHEVVPQTNFLLKFHKEIYMAAMKCDTDEEKTHAVRSACSSEFEV